MKKTLLILAFISFALAQTGQVSGTVFDAKTGEPIAGANVMVKNTFLGASADAEGKFLIKKVPIGTQIMMVSVIGYQVQEIEIEILPRTKQTVQFKMEENVLQAPQVTVTGNRKTQTYLESTVSIDVVDYKEIEERNAYSMEDVLNYKVGVSTINGQLSIRGSQGYTTGSGSRVLVLVDGVPMLSGDAGGINWDLIPVNQIESVEILKGSGSALYGANAMGGVVNIRTKEAGLKNKFGVQMSGGFYSQPYYEQWQFQDGRRKFVKSSFGRSQSFGKHNFLVSVDHLKTEGMTEAGWENRLNLIGKGKFNFTDNANLTIYGNYKTGDHGFAATWDDAREPFAVSEDAKDDIVFSQNGYANANFNFTPSAKTHFNAKAYAYKTFWRTNWHEWDEPDSSRSGKYGGDLQFDSILGKHSFTLGSSAIYSEVKSAIFDNHSSWDYAAFLQNDFELSERIHLSIGGRFDCHEVDDGDAEQKFIPKLGIVWQPYPITSLRASWGKGFRGASVAEMFTSTQVLFLEVRPNPELVSETSTSYEMGLSHILPGMVFVNAAIFRNDYTNMIEPLLVADSTEAGNIEKVYIKFQNFYQARIDGFEIDFRIPWVADKVTQQFAYTFLNSQDLEKDEPLAYRNKHNFFTIVDMNGEKWKLGLEWRFLSRIDKVRIYQENENTGQDKRIPVKLANLRFMRDFKHFRFQFRVDNLFQYYYTLLERNMVSERKFTATISTAF